MRRVAIVGAGSVADLHVQALRDVADARVTWIADPDLERATTLALPLGAAATMSHEEAIAAADVDVVIVAAPTGFHRNIVERAANRGKHVLCEAPLAPSSADARAMILACETAGVRLMIGHPGRFAPECARIKTALEAGDLGQIGVVRMSRVGPADSDRQASIIDLMVEDLDVLRWWFGDAARVFALGPRSLASGWPLDYVQAVVRFENGVIAHVEASRAHAKFRTTVEIAGEHGVLTSDSEESSPFRLDISHQNHLEDEVTRFGAWPARAYVEQFRHFCDRLDDGAPFLAPGEDGLRTLALASAVAASASSGRPVLLAAGHPIALEASK